MAGARNFAQGVAMRWCELLPNVKWRERKLHLRAAIYYVVGPSIRLQPHWRCGLDKLVWRAVAAQLNNRSELCKPGFEIDAAGKRHAQ